MPLGCGDVDFAASVAVLTKSGYDAWYILEQDVILEALPVEGDGTVGERGTSLRYLRSLATD